MLKAIPEMKNKKIQLLFLIFLSALSHGATLDDVISEYEQKSYTTKINQANLRTYDIKDKALKKGDWNTIKLTSENTYEKNKTYDGISMENTATFGMLYYKNGYNFTNKEFTENKVGVTKTLNDFFYGDNKYNKKSR